MTSLVILSSFCPLPACRTSRQTQCFCTTSVKQAPEGVPLLLWTMELSSASLHLAYSVAKVALQLRLSARAVS